MTISNNDNDNDPHLPAHALGRLFIVSIVINA